MSSSQPESYLKLGLVVLFLLMLVIFSFRIFPQTPLKPLISPGFLKGINLTSTFEYTFRSEGLSKIVSDNLQGKEGEYAVYIEELSATTSAHLRGGVENKADSHLGGEVKDDPEIYTLRSSDSFPAASLYKVYLIAAVLKEVEQSVILGSEATPESKKDSGQARMTMQTRLNASKSHLIDVYGGVDFGYEDAPEQIGYTVEEALTRVGRISDNFAAIMLMDKVGTEKVQAVADSLGARNTLMKSPITTSADDMGAFFRALYRKEVVSPAVAEQITKFLSFNQLNDRIPAGISNSDPSNASNPPNPTIIHKTGELAGVRHDAGIVILPEKAYVIVLMSKSLKYEDEGVETLARISKDVYEYFKGKKKD